MGLFSFFKKKRQIKEEQQKRQDEKDLNLYWSANNGSAYSVENLVKNGANVNAMTIKGTPLMAAVEGSHMGIVQFLLDNGAKINDTFEGKTVLMRAAMRNNMNMVKFLLEKGADRNLKSNEGETALDLAKRYKWPEIVRILETRAVGKDIIHGLDIRTIQIPHASFDSVIEDQAIIEGTKVIATNNIDKFISICEKNRMGMLKYPIDKIEDVVRKLIDHFKSKGAGMDFIMASMDLRVFCPNDACEFSNVHLEILKRTFEKLGMVGMTVYTDKPHSYGYECPVCRGKDVLFFFDNWHPGQISEKDLDALTQYYKYNALLSLQEKNVQSIPCKVCEKRIDASNLFLVTSGHTAGTFTCKDCFAKQYLHNKESFLNELRNDPSRIGRSQLRNARNYMAGIFEKKLFPPTNL